MTNDDFFCVGKCDVCGEEGLIELLPSFLNRDETYSYCSDCMKQKAEPYDGCVSAVFVVGWENLSPSYQDLIKYSLTKNNKTLDDLFKDVAKLDNAYVEWCESELGSDGSLY